MKNIYAIVVLMMALPVVAQTGIGIQTPDSDASLELGATDKGLLLSRVALTGTTNSVPLFAHVIGMAIYNTAAVGASGFRVTVTSGRTLFFGFIQDILPETYSSWKRMLSSHFKVVVNTGGHRRRPNF